MLNTISLCVGINNFRNFPQNGLQGCVNDSTDWYTFADETLESTAKYWLQNFECTKKGIMDTLRLMVKTANENNKINRLFFTMSSHGSQQADLDGDESDRLDECFICHDTAFAGGKYDPATIILDDELWALFSTVRKDCLVEVFLDTCSSGTGLRLLDPAKGRPRFLPNPFIKASHQRKVKHDLPENVILWAGCKANQYSMDALIEDEYHGAATFAFMQAFGEKKKRSQILRDAQKWLDDNDMDQTMQLECSDKLKNITVIK